MVCSKPSILRPHPLELCITVNLGVLIVDGDGSIDKAKLKIYVRTKERTSKIQLVGLAGK